MLRNRKLYSDLRKKLFMVRMVKHWNDPRGTVDPWQNPAPEWMRP